MSILLYWIKIVLKWVLYDEPHRIVASWRFADWQIAKSAKIDLWVRRTLTAVPKLTVLFICASLACLCYVWLFSITDTRYYGFWGGLLHGIFLPGFLAQHLFWSNKFFFAPYHSVCYVWGYITGSLIWLYWITNVVVRTLIFDVAREVKRQQAKTETNILPAKQSGKSHFLQEYLQEMADVPMSTDITKKVMKVFISSTFQDMQKERDCLMLQIFPRLIRKARLRGVTLIPVDLRWGITEEESRTGKVLEICLREIDNAKPFFIGILGDRYGWCPTDDDVHLNNQLLHLFPWMANDIVSKMSVTEMEIQYGALRRSEKVNAAFYFKGVEYSPNKWFDKLIFNNDAMQDDKLTMLRRKIFDDHRYPVSSYNEVDELGDLVEQDMNKLLDQYFPTTEVDEKDLEQYEQVVRRQELTENYIPIEDNNEALDQFWISNGKVMIVCGKEGSGRSSAVIHWMKLRGMIENHESALLLTPYDNGCHTFIGDLQRIKETKVISDDTKVFAYIGKTNITPEEIEIFNHIAENHDIKTKIIVVSDILIENTSQFPNITFHQLQTPDATQLKRYIELYLKRHCKKLQPCQLNRVLDWAERNTMETLKLLLHELVIFGNYEELDAKIDELTAGENESDFYDILLQHIENQYGHRLTHTTLAYAVMSASGLGEEQLVELVCNVSLFLDKKSISRFLRGCCAFEDNKGHLVIINRKMMEAIIKRYLSNPDKVSRTKKKYKFWTNMAADNPLLTLY